MVYLEILVLFLFGLCFGSFLNVLTWRMADERAPKFWEGRSICPKCKHSLTWFDNIPLLSFLFLRGQCKYCHKKISIQYPLVELLTAVLTVLIVLNLSYLGYLSVISYLIIVYSFIVIFFADLRYQIIPDEMLILILIFGAALGFGGVDVWVGLASVLGFFLIVLATKFQGMGLGDVKLAFVMGFLLGFPNILVAIWVAFIAGGIFAISLLILHRKKIHETMALGPFLVLGTLIAALWSTDLLQLIGY